MPSWLFAPIIAQPLPVHKHGQKSGILSVNRMCENRRRRLPTWGECLSILSLRPGSGRGRQERRPYRRVRLTITVVLPANPHPSIRCFTALTSYSGCSSTSTGSEAFSQNQNAFSIRTRFSLRCVAPGWPLSQSWNSSTTGCVGCPPCRCQVCPEPRTGTVRSQRVLPVGVEISPPVRNKGASTDALLFNSIRGG